MKKKLIYGFLVLLVSASIWGEFKRRDINSDRDVVSLINFSTTLDYISGKSNSHPTLKTRLESHDYRVVYWLHNNYSSEAKATIFEKSKELQVFTFYTKKTKLDALEKIYKSNITILPIR